MTLPRLDVCLIVKNEEASLPGCLASLDLLRPIVNEICVYDTGSTDETRSIARAAGCRVETGHWDGDFARARNASLDMARMPWALIVDADDEVIADVSALRCLLSSLEEVDVVTATFTHVDESGCPQSTSRRFALVRNDRIRFRSAIHEVPVRLDGSETSTAQADQETLAFRHWGYTTAEVRQAKARRNLPSTDTAVSRARRSGDPALLAESLYHRGRTQLLLNSYAAASADLSEALALLDPQLSDLRCRVAIDLMPALLSAEQHGPAMSLIDDLSAAPSETSTAQLLLGQLLVALGEGARAYEVLTSIDATKALPPWLDIGAIFAARLRAAHGCGQADTVLADLLVLVGHEQRLELVPHLMNAWGEQSPAALAALLRADSPTDQAHLRAALSMAGERGKVAARLL